MPLTVEEHNQRRAAEADKRHAKWLKWHSEGASYAQIGKRVGVSRQRVHQAVERYRQRLEKRGKNE